MSSIYKYYFIHRRKNDVSGDFFVKISFYMEEPIDPSFGNRHLYSCAVQVAKL